jgi:class 3 adenylate cyclase
MVVGGLPLPRADHLEAIAGMALDVLVSTAQFARTDGKPFQLRVGIHTGPVVAGVIGTKKFAYDLWGDTVNIASRMESQGVPNAIQVTQDVYERLQHCYQFQPRGEITIKGKGNMMTYLLTGHKN